MFFEFLRFELRYWFRGWMIWIFFVVIGGMILGAVSSDAVRIGGALENTYRNAPYVIQNFYSFIGVLTLLMTTAFINSAAARDFQHNTAQMLFATPLRRGDYLFGRFCGAVIAGLIPTLGVSAGALLGPLMPWVDAERFGPIVWGAHVWGVLTFALPNAIITSAFVFAIAALTRSTIASFLGSLLFLVGSAVSESLTEDLDNQRIAELIDPFAARTFSLVTKYWTVAERNAQFAAWDGPLLWNRLLWLGIAALILAFTYWRFSLSERASKTAAVAADATSPAPPMAIPLQPKATGDALFTRFRSVLAFEFKGLVRNTTFVVLLAAALLNSIPSLFISANEGYGNSSLPVTYWIVNLLQGTAYAFLVAMITYYAGVLVWRERDARMDEIHDVTPLPSWISYAAKLASLTAAIALIQLLLMLGGIAVQTYNGYTRYQIDLYLAELFVLDFSGLFFLMILAFFIHVLSPNKYVGYFAFIIFLIANAFVWRPLNVGTRLLRYGSRPEITYSDLYGFAPFLKDWGWFTAYWLAFAAFLAVLTAALWPRGKEVKLNLRWAAFPADLRRWAWGALAVFAALGGWLAYNTLVLNKVTGPETALDLQADYEKTYKKYRGLPQPRVTSVRYEIALYPERRAMVMKGDQRIRNNHSQPIAELHLSFDRREFAYEINIEGTKLQNDDARLGYSIYKLDPPMAPGEERRMTYTVRREPKGITNSTGGLQFVQNGTFFNNSIAPQIGYQPEAELSERNDRKKRGLPEKDLMPALERDCTAKCADTYLSNNSDWVTIETVISTAPDQIAIAPGSLKREWNQDGRRFFHYQADREVLNFYSFLSARYSVLREDSNGVVREVYYHADHPWNVPKMMKSMEKSLDYYNRNFGPYGHRQARIIEFPRIAGFAQAFPGTMPYSESIGFISKIQKPDDIDMVYYVVAHEMAHQWWAHQVVGANMRGATLLSETLAQYSALMVMEKEYGRDLMRKFLEYEADRYLSSRGQELLKERPLRDVEAQQGYIHYRKGSVAMYYLKEMIGEEAVNRALRKLVTRYAYASAPYPTAYALIDALREETPAELQYLIRDLFEEITLFANRTVEAKAAKRADGKFDITIDVETRKFRADEKGNEQEVPVADYVEIGAFAKPEKDQRYGRTLHRERVRITTPKARFQFVTSELPDKAGVDPFRLLIDRIPDDNMKKVSGE